ncbi:MAG TPA: efflux RND transporter periplasmic adaptor subunit [Xanthomonadales bacterium]|nr:efflux RND transporter periplasmic adaptor subunit [Xanthomonadales bacterium]
MKASFHRPAPLALVAGILLALALAGCGSEAATPHAPPAPEVSVATVVAKPVREWDDFTGRVVAVETVELRARVSGYVERVVFEEGQEVAKGDVLFTIDESRYRADYDKALADLERARSEAQLARTQDARAESLVAARAISREEFETRQAATARANAGVRAAEAAVARARLDLEYTQVRSPITGRAGRALVTVGNLAQADVTLLTTLVSLDPVHVYFEGDEQAYLRLAKEARGGDSPAGSGIVRVGLADEEGHPHLGRVDFVDNQVDPRTGTIRARAVLPNHDRAFTPGLFARVQLERATETDALLIDDKAVLTDQDRKYVYVLGDGNAAVRRDVVLGASVDGLRVVTSGLQAQDRVIVSGVQKVFFPGMTVAPQSVAMGAAPAAVLADGSGAP